MTKFILTDGTKNINLSAITADEWRVIFGNDAIDAPVNYYAAVSFMYRCVEVRANALASVPWSVQRGDTELWTNDADEVPPELEYLGVFEDLLWQSEAALSLTSAAYWMKVRSRAGVREIRWLDPNTMQPVWDASKGLVGFERSLHARRVVLQPDDVVYLRLPGQRETSPRVAPAEAAAAEAGILYNTNKFVAGFFERGAIKATLLTVEGTPPQAERERLKAWWRRAFDGVKNAWNSEVISAAVTPVVIGEGIAELSNTELTSGAREGIATAFGVPHSLVMSNAANFATAEADRLNFYDTTIVPECRLIERQLNKQLFAPLGLRFVFRPQEMSLYQEDEEQRSQAFANYVNAGLKPSVVAQMLGLHLPEGVTPESLDPEPEPEPQTVTVLPPRALPQPQPPQLEDSQQQAKAEDVRKLRRWAKGKKAPDVAQFHSDVLTDDEKRAALASQEAATAQDFFTKFIAGPITPESWKALRLQLDPDDDEAEQVIRMAVERRTVRNLREAFNEMIDTLFPEGYGEFLDPQLEAARIHRRFLEDQKLRDAVSRAIQDSADLGVSVAIEQMDNIGFGFDYTLAHIEARDWALQYTDDLLARLGTTTERGVGQAIARWAENGEPLDALINDLQAFFGPERAELVASTEVTRAYAEGTQVAYQTSGVIKELSWKTARDEKVCPVCGALDGKRRKFGEPFDQNILLPPAHPRCRCWVTGVV